MTGVPGIAAVTRIYRPEIDGLRAIAVASVILYHTGSSLVGGGFVGVDIFFVISGFLITGIVYGELVEGRFSITRFYERRARRILPAVFVVLAACLVPAYLLLTPEQLRYFSQSVVAVVTFLSNHYFLMRTGYFSPGAHEIPLLHTWTLSVEEQFYVVLPVAMLLVMRYRPQWLKAALVLALAASFALSLRYEQTAPLINFFIAPTRAWEFLVGSLLAVTLATRGGRFAVPASVAQGASLLGLGCLAWAITQYHNGTSFPGLGAVVPVIGSALVIAFATPQTVTGRLLSLPPMVGLGLISYSAYLWHQPVLSFWLLASGEHAGLAGTGLLLAVIVGLSYLSWRYVETPFRDRKRVSTRAIVVIAVAGTALFAAIGVAGHLTRGLPGRYSAEQNALVATATASPQREACHQSFTSGPGPAEACRYFDGPATWAVFGDSHGVEIAYALAEKLGRANAGSVLHLTASGCQPATGFESNVAGCSDWVRAALEVVERDAGVRDVVLVYRHAFHLSGSQVLRYPQIPDDRPLFMPAQAPAAAREAYWQGYVEVVTRLQRAGKTVYVLDPLPELGRSVEWHAYSPLLQASPTARMQGPGLDYYRARNAFILSKLDSLAYGPTLVRVPTVPALCGDQACLVGDGRELYYFDDNHVSVAGARRVADQLLAVAARQREPSASGGAQ